MPEQKLNYLLFFGALLIIFFADLIHPVLGHDGDDDGAVDQHDGGGCEPNEDETGITCTNVTLYHTEVLGNPFWCSADIENWFNSTEEIFHTYIWIYVSFSEFNNTLWAEVYFNSTTPNNSVLASGSTTIGEFDLPTLRPEGIPSISAEVNASHSVLLVWNDDCADDPDNNAFCDSGTIWAFLDLEAFGEVVTNNSVTITGTIVAPNAVVVNAPFEFAVNETWYCASISEDIVYDKELTVQFEVCDDSQPPQCDPVDYVFNTTTWDKHKDLADLCFEHSIEWEE